MAAWIGIVRGIRFVCLACGILYGCSGEEVRPGELVLDPGSLGISLVYQDEAPVGRGSAFVLGPERRVVTCAHSVEHGNRYQLQAAGAVADAGSHLFQTRMRLVKKYEDRDLAVLKAMDPAALEAVEPLELGD